MRALAVMSFFDNVKGGKNKKAIIQCINRDNFSSIHDGRGGNSAKGGAVGEGGKFVLLSLAVLIRGKYKKEKENNPLRPEADNRTIRFPNSALIFFAILPLCWHRLNLATAKPLKARCWSCITWHVGATSKPCVSR